MRAMSIRCSIEISQVLVVNMNVRLFPKCFVFECDPIGSWIPGNIPRFQDSRFITAGNKNIVFAGFFCIDDYPVRRDIHAAESSPCVLKFMCIKKIRIVRIFLKLAQSLCHQTLHFRVRSLLKPILKMWVKFVQHFHHTLILYRELSACLLLIEMFSPHLHFPFLLYISMLKCCLRQLQNVNTRLTHSLHLSPLYGA